MTAPVAFGSLEFYETVAADLNADPAWAEMSRTLSYSMIFSYGPPISGDFFVSFDGGKISGMRTADEADFGSADFIIGASSDIWRTIVEGKTNPTMALARGQIKITGDKMLLMGHMAAFQYLFKAMGQVPLQ